MNYYFTYGDFLESYEENTKSDIFSKVEGLQLRHQTTTHRV